MTTFQDAGATLKLKKPEFFAEFDKLLGHVMGPGRLLTQDA